jgi:hypothetical protein
MQDGGDHVEGFKSWFKGWEKHIYCQSLGQRDIPRRLKRDNRWRSFHVNSSLSQTRTNTSATSWNPYINAVRGEIPEHNAVGGGSVIPSEESFPAYSLISFACYHLSLHLIAPGVVPGNRVKDLRTS